MITVHEYVIIVCFWWFKNQAVSRGDANMDKDGVFQLIQAHQVFHIGSVEFSLLRVNSEVVEIEWIFMGLIGCVNFIGVVLLW